MVLLQTTSAAMTEGVQAVQRSWLHFSLWYGYQKWKHTLFHTFGGTLCEIERAKNE